MIKVKVYYIQTHRQRENNMPPNLIEGAQKRCGHTREMPQSETCNVFGRRCGRINVDKPKLTDITGFSLYNFYP